jgi:hypothetical protein
LAPLKFPEVPKRGDLDVDIVKDSPYFFSWYDSLATTDIIVIY